LARIDEHLIDAAKLLRDFFMTRILSLFAVLGAASAFVATPLPRAGAVAACVPPIAAVMSDATATAPPPAPAAPAASPRPSVWRRAISLPIAVPRAVWRRCTDELCDVGRPRPFQLLKSLIPKRRPLNTLAGAESSSGIYKVERRDGKRVMKLFPLPTLQREVSTEDALSMF
jgi:hypothetical protein